MDNRPGVKGAGTARNTGLEHAFGKYIFFADADDTLCPDFPIALSDYMDKEYDIVFFLSTSSAAADGSHKGRHLPYYRLVNDYLHTPSPKSELRLRYKFCVPWAKLYRHDFLDENHLRFDATHRSEDLYFSTLAGSLAKCIAADARVVYCVN